MAKNINVLLTFEDAQFEKSIKGLLSTKGVNATIHAVFSKDSVARYIRENPNTDAVVLMEVFARRKEHGKAEKYTAEEVAQLTGASDVNVIMILGENHKGTSYMGTLYSAGVTSAIFQKKGGVRPAEVAGLILQKRTRNAAREYYGIGSQIIDVGAIESADYNRLYAKYKGKDGDNLVENYIKVCSELSMQQVADFTRRLPDDDKAYLAQFEEFHVVLGFLKKLGIDLKIKRPKTVSIGLKYVYSIGMNDAGSRMEFEKTGETENVDEVAGEEDTAKVSVFGKLFGKKKEKSEPKKNEEGPQERVVADDVVERKQPVVSDADATIVEAKPAVMKMPAEDELAPIKVSEDVPRKKDTSAEVVKAEEANAEKVERDDGLEEKKIVKDESPDASVSADISFADFLSGFGSDEGEDEYEGDEVTPLGEESAKTSISSTVADIPVVKPALEKPKKEMVKEVIATPKSEEESPKAVAEEVKKEEPAEEEKEPITFDESEYDEYMLLGETKGSGKAIAIVLALVLIGGLTVAGYMYGFGNLF